VQTGEIVSPLRNHVHARNEAGGNGKNAIGEKSPVSMVIDGDPVRRRRRPAHPAPARVLGLFPRPRPRSSRARALPLPAHLPRAASLPAAATQLVPSAPTFPPSLARAPAIAPSHSRACARHLPARSRGARLKYVKSKPKF